MSKLKLWFATAALSAALSMSAHSAFADGNNEVRAVTYDEDGAITRIHVRGAETPTFTVYKLERPNRVVVDIPRAQLAEVMRHDNTATFSPGTWAVSSIATSQLDDEVVIMVTARDPAPKVVSPDQLAAAQADADRLKKQAALEAARAETAQKAADDANKSSQASKAEIERTKADAAKAQAAAAQAKLAADNARTAAEHAKAEAVADAERAKADAAAAKDETAKAKVDAQTQVAKAQAEAAAAKDDAAKAHRDAEAVRAAAAQDKREAEADKRSAEAARSEADHTMQGAKQQLATLDKKIATEQMLEDKARVAHAAAEAREEAAREAEGRAQSERLAAEDAAKRAMEARDRSSSQAKEEREKLVAEAHAAEDRLARAKAATDAAEAQRTAAEAAVTGAKHDLETTRGTLASVEQQRTAAESAASDAARKRGDAEAAASDATRRRHEAEAAAQVAGVKKTEAELAANTATKARDEADKQRGIAEAAAHKAETAKQSAESSLSELTARRDAAEKAAADVESRTKAAAKAQAELAAAEAHKAGEAEIVAAKAELARLADARKHAEQELADRRKEVASQQVVAEKANTAAGEARDTADREENRRARLAVAQSTPSSITAINFAGDSTSSRVDLAMTGEPHVAIGAVSPTAVELLVDNAELATKLERTLDVSRFGGPVRSVSSFHDPRMKGRVRLVAELSSPATPALTRDGAGVHWQLVAAQTVAKAAPAAGSPRAAHTTDIPGTVVGGFGASSTPIAQQSVSQIAPQGSRNHIYHGATIDFDFKDAPIHDLLRIIADTGHVSIVVPDTIDARVTVRLKAVPWDQALEVILSSHGLWYRHEGKIYRIAPRKELDAEDEAENARRAAMVQAEAPRPEIVRLNYVSATELRVKLLGMLSPKGQLQVEERDNALIINDVAGNREVIARLALELDTQTPQISIEARIVEANSNFSRQIGIQWGGHSLNGASGGNATGLQFPSTVGVTGANTDANTISTGVANPSDFAVNMPAATGAGEGGALGLALGSIGGNFDINLRLSALEDTNSVRIISAPKVTVMNNVEAKISQGVSIPISVVSAAGTQTQFVQADLSLTVTPYVSQRDCAIAMKLFVSKNEPNFAQTGARGDPTILRKEAKTQMLVQDGETAVLGGIYTRNTGLQYKKVPWFGDLPVLGWLFKNRSENDDRTEVLVFITPKITNKASLHCQ
jgi:type IV pilus assembly protein PilQ